MVLVSSNCMAFCTSSMAISSPLSRWTIFCLAVGNLKTPALLFNFLKLECLVEPPLWLDPSLPSPVPVEMSDFFITDAICNSE